MLYGLLSHRQSGYSKAALTLVISFSLLCGAGCADMFSHSFVETFFPDEDGSSAFLAVEPPTGHIPIIFVNNARIADDVFTYLTQGDTVVRQEVVDELLRVNPQWTSEDITAVLESILLGNPTNLEDLILPPRVRVTLDVTNSDNGVQTLEFLDGLRLARGEDQVGGTPNIAELPPDLEQNTNSIYVVQCDISSIEIVRIEVFVPVVLRQIETVQDSIPGGGVVIYDRCTGFIPPFFDTLLPDTTYDAGSGTYNILRNYDPRFYPEEGIDNIACGAVVQVELSGALSLPFRDVSGDLDCLPDINPPANGRVPGYYTDRESDLVEFERIPGRYDVNIRLRDD